MMTGQELWKYTQSIIDKDYSDYVSPVKANRMFKACLYNLIDRKIEAGDSQKLYDEISSLITSERRVPLVNNRVVKGKIDIESISSPSVGQIKITTRVPHNLIYDAADPIEVVIMGLGDYTAASWPATDKYTTVITNNTGSGLTVTGPNTLLGTFPLGLNGSPYLGGGSMFSYDTTFSGDYYQEPWLKSYYKMLSTKVSYKSISEPVTIYSNGTKLYVTTRLSSRLRDGDFLVGGSTLKKLTSTKFEALYNGASYSGAAIDKTASTAYAITTRYCTPISSDKKINSLATGDIWTPTYEDAEGAIIYNAGGGITCTSAHVDYVSEPILLVDVENNSIDLSLTYKGKFLYALAMEFANLFAQQSKDDGLYRSSENEIIQNP